MTKVPGSSPIQDGTSPYQDHPSGVSSRANPVRGSSHAPEGHPVPWMGAETGGPLRTGSRGRRCDRRKKSNDGKKTRPPSPHSTSRRPGPVRNRFRPPNPSRIGGPRGRRVRRRVQVGRTDPDGFGGATGELDPRPSESPVGVPWTRTPLPVAPGLFPTLGRSVDKGGRGSGPKTGSGTVDVGYRAGLSLP